MNICPNCLTYMNYPTCPNCGSFTIPSYGSNEQLNQQAFQQPQQYMPAPQYLSYRQYQPNNQFQQNAYQPQPLINEQQETPINQNIKPKPHISTIVLSVIIALLTCYIFYLLPQTEPKELTTEEKDAIAIEQLTLALESHDFNNAVNITRHPLSEDNLVDEPSMEIALNDSTGAPKSVDVMILEEDPFKAWGLILYDDVYADACLNTEERCKNEANRVLYHLSAKWPSIFRNLDSLSFTFGKDLKSIVVLSEWVQGKEVEVKYDPTDA